MDFQIMLLPRERYWAWARACSQYVQTYALNLTSDPVGAASYMSPGQVVTFPNIPDAHPEQGDLVEWFEANYPGIRIDPVLADSPQAFTDKLQTRLDAQDRYGQRQRPFYLLWPTNYPVITQKFGANPQIYTRFGMPGHEGLDIRALPYTDIYSCADGVVYEVHTNSKDHAYGIHVRIRHQFGYRTVYGHLAKPLVRLGQQVAEGEVIGKADSSGASTASHLHLSLKQDGATARKETNYPKDIIDPTPLMVWPDSSRAKQLHSGAWPAGKCLVGLHHEAGSSLTDEEIQVLVSTRIEALKIGPAESSDAIASLLSRIPGILLVVRLTMDLSGDSVEPGGFVRHVEADARRLYDAGVREFEVHANPNLQSGGWRRSWRDGASFAEWFMQVTDRLGKSFPEARWGFPGLSPGGFVSGWREDPIRFLEEADQAVQSASWIGVNCHWTSPAGMRSQEGGLAFKIYQARFPGKRLVVTEFDNSSLRVTPETKAEQYMAYFRMLRHEPDVAAAFVYRLPAAGGNQEGLWTASSGPTSIILSRLANRPF